MTTARGRREAAAYLIGRNLLARRACALVGISRRWRGYQSRRKEDGLSWRLLELAARHPRYGYRRLHQMLLRQGAKVNVKRVRRLCVALGVKLLVRQKRKRRGIGVSQPVKAEYPNHGRTILCLTGARMGGN
ncbi:MAG TPA: IS3 family transposase [Phycisphaerae bacterium]|nr:IS3 family transposase [Phycisphaerae bacterium]